MADVARLAGVSHQTVSRVINGQNNLRPATRERVEQAIRQLGYRPNTAARALVTRRSATIGVIGTDERLLGSLAPCTAPSRPPAARPATSSARSTCRAVTREELTDAVDHLRGQSVEGIVLIAANDEALEVARAQETGGVPVVVVEGDLSGPAGRSASTRSPARELGHRAPHRPRPHRHRPRRRARRAGPRPTPASRAGSEAMHDAGLRPLARRPGRLDRRQRLSRPAAVLADRRDVTAVFVRQRPDGHRRAARAVRGRPRPCPTTSASSASTTSPRRRTSSRR